MTKGFLTRILAVLFFLILDLRPVGAGTNDILGVWTQRLKPPTYPGLTDVAFGLGRFVAVGVGGTVVFSEDATRWSQVQTGTSADLKAVTFTDTDVFIAVGASQTILISTDGVNWTQVRSNKVGALTSVVYGGGKYIAVGPGSSPGENGPIYLTSNDAENWSEVSTTNAFYAISYGNNQFVAAPVWSYPPRNRLMMSNNGIDWQESDPLGAYYPGVSISRIQFVNGQFYATGSFNYNAPDAIPYIAGALFTSADGLTWRSVTFNSRSFLTGLTAGIGRIVGSGIKVPSYSSVISTNIFFNSVDGQNWIATPPPSSSAEMRSIVFGNSDILPGDGVFVSVGGDAGTSCINISQDGVSWAQAFVNFTSAPTPVNGQAVPTRTATFNSIAASANTIVAVGTNWVATSTNGVDWETQSVPYDLNAVSGGDFPPASGAGLFLAAGKGVIGMSQDGFDWTWTPKAANYYSTLVTPGALLLAGDSPEGLSVSTNGTTWKTIFTNSFYTYSTYLPASPHLLAYGNGVYVAAQLFIYGPGYDSQILTSADAQSWSTNLTVPFSSSGSWISDLRFGNETFIASPGLWTSSDGQTWRQESPPIQDARLGYGKGLFVAVAADGSLNYSTNGHAWTGSGNPWLPYAGANSQAKAVAFAFNSFFIVGDGGLIVQSSPILLAPMLSARADGSKIALVLNGPAGSYHLLHSTSLTSWEDLGPVTIGNESDTLIYSGERQSSQEFFQVVAQ